MNEVKGKVYTQKASPYYWLVLDYRDAEGNRKRPWINTHIPVKGNNKRLAQAKLKEVLAELDLHQVDLSKDILFTTFMAQWLETRKETKSIASTTYDGYKMVYDAHILPYFEPLKLSVRDITPAHLEKYVSIKTKVISTNTVIKHLHNISKCLDAAIRQSIIAFNPAKRFDWP